MQKLSNTGRRRLTVFLSCLSGASCALAMVMVLIVYGTPYDSLWWWVMAAILAGAFIVPRFLLYPIEWVITGYSNED